MNKQLFISVVIPTYHRPIELRNTLKGVLNQSHSNFEVLVVNDDLQDDRIQKIVLELNDNRLKYLINERKKGPCGARNTGILAAKGQVVAFLDDDDEWFSQRLSELNKKFLEPNVYGIITGYRLRLKNNSKDVYLKHLNNVLGNYLADNFSLGSGSNLAIKSEIVKEIGLFDENLTRQEDTEYFVRYLSKYAITIISNPLFEVNYNYNRPDPGITIRTRNEFLKKNLSIINELNITHKNLFYSNHFKRLALLYLQMGDKNAAFRNLKKARNYRFISIRKDVKFFVILGKQLF